MWDHSKLVNKLFYKLPPPVEVDANCLLWCIKMQSNSICQEASVHLLCRASEDSILDYGQYVILSTGNFLGSAPTVNSSMDFSTKPVDDGVVDSPPNQKPRLAISCSPSPLRSRGQPVTSMDADDLGKVPQRRLYGDANYEIVAPETRAINNDKAHGMNLTHTLKAPSNPGFKAPFQRQSSKRKHDGPSCSASSAPSWDSWERRSLRAQQRDQIREAGKITKGNSRGPEIWKAMERMNSLSHSH